MLYLLYLNTNSSTKWLALINVSLHDYRVVGGRTLSKVLNLSKGDLMVLNDCNDDDGTTNKRKRDNKN
jgi:hypothetical protein